jgi:uncharacterized protein YcbK (DUF882 family)
VEASDSLRLVPRAGNMVSKKTRRTPSYRRAGSDTGRGTGLPRQRSRTATAEWRIVSVAIISAFVASCTATADPTLDFSNPSFAEDPGASSGMMASGTVADDGMTSAESTAPLPQSVAYVPAVKPAEAFTALQDGTTATGAIADAPASAATAQVSTPQAAQAAASDAQAQSAVAAAPADAPVPTANPAGTPVADTGFYVTATDPATVAPPPPPKKRSLFASLFGSTPATAAPLIAPEPQQPKPVIQLASAGPSKPQVRQASLAGGADQEDLNPLPGVRQTALFEIKRKSGIDDDSDVDLHEDEESAPIRIASAAGLARLAPNGLVTQTDQVDVACLKPSLVRVLKTVEQHYGRKIVVTSGYRSPSHNRRARGAKNSLHMFCAAADIQVPGVGKWELASYFRTMPGRGGVGTYCHTESVHIDVGPERDWNWRCRRRK